MLAFGHEYEMMIIDNLIFWENKEKRMCWPKIFIHANVRLECW